MKTWIALVCYGVVLLAAFRLTYSAGGFVLTGLGLTFALDRYFFRLLPWRSSHWIKELAVRGGVFLGGAVAISRVRAGVVPLWEAAYWGLMLCLVTAVLEGVGHWLGSGRRRLVAGATLTVLAGLLVPLVAGLHPLHTVPKRTPAAFGMPFEEVHFRADDGVGLAGWLIPHPHARGNVLFCHGHGRNRGHVAGLLQTFHDLGLNVLAFDFRGHGESAGHTSTFGHLEVQDLVAADAYLRQRCPRLPVFLVGISLGAAVSLQALPALPHVRGVWSEGSFARFGNAVDNKFSWVPAPLRGVLVGLYYRLGWLDCRLWGPALNPVERLQGVRVPIFFCHATGDTLVPPGEGQVLYDSYGGPKENWWVEGASHYNVRQRHPDEYLRRLRAFLEGLLPPVQPTGP